MVFKYRMDTNMTIPGLVSPRRILNHRGAEAQRKSTERKS